MNWKTLFEILFKGGSDKWKSKKNKALIPPALLRDNADHIVVFIFYGGGRLYWGTTTPVR